MRKFKLENKEQQQLSDEEISKYKDFGQVVTNYEDALHRWHKKPLYKDPRAFLVLVVIILLAYFISEMNSPEESPNPDAQQEQMDD